jgi:AraC-like DNA-binding protein
MLAVTAGIKTQIDGAPYQFKKVGDLLDHLNVVNRNTVVTAFKDLYSAGVAEYMCAQRLEASKKLLEEGEAIKIIARICYYKNQCSYCKAFKRFFVIPPSEWQRL